MDRRDLLNGINDFLSDSIVLPPGDFDKELLLPIIETAKIKHTKAKRRSTRKQKQVKEGTNENSTQPSVQCKSCFLKSFLSLQSLSLSLFLSIPATRLLGNQHRSVFSRVSNLHLFQHKYLLCPMRNKRKILF